MSNADASKKRMYVGRNHAGEKWTDVLVACPESVTIDSRGYGVFPVAALSVGVWVNAAAEGRDTFGRHLYVIMHLVQFLDMANEATVTRISISMIRLYEPDFLPSTTQNIF